MTRSNKRTALYLAAVAVTFYLGFILMGVLRA
ncbi:MAG: cytochrome oxidase small assembly protein [Woeseiaceae bacterium]